MMSEHDSMDYGMDRIEKMSEHDLHDYGMGRIKMKKMHDSKSLILLIFKSCNRVQTRVKLV